MTASVRSPSAPATASRWTPGRRRFAKILAWLLILGVLSWGGFTWLFFDPFEGRVERLDRVIPSSVVWAVRGSLDGVLGSPFVRERILARAEVEDLLRAGGVEEALRSAAEEQERLNARLPGILGGFDLRRDVLGQETALFGGGDGVAVATRLRPKARAALSLLKHDWARRRVEAGGGPKITRYPLVYELDLSARVADPALAKVWAALVRDVLVAGNDQKLVQDAAHLAATGGGGSLPDLANARTVFSADGPSPVRGWVDLAGWPEARDAAAALEGPAAFAALILDPPALSSAQAAASFPSAEQALLEVSGIRSDAAAGLAAGLAEGAVRTAPEMLKEAALLGPAGSTVAAARVEARAGALLRAAWERIEPSVREEIGKNLAAEKTTFEDLCREVDDVLEPGVSVIVERLPECDGLPLDRMGADEKGEYVLPVPGLLLVLRQRASAGEGAAEGWFRRWLEGGKEGVEGVRPLEGLPAGTRGFRFRPKFLTADKALWRPAAAFEGDLVLLALNEGTLLRALEARAGKRPALADFEGFAAAVERCGQGQVAAFVEMGAALKMRRDERREWATRRVEKDWAKVRARLHAEVVAEAAGNRRELLMKDLEEEVEKRMAEAERVQAEVEFPRALEEFARGLQALEDLRSVAAGVEWDSAGFRMVLSVDTGR